MTTPAELFTATCTALWGDQFASQAAEALAVTPNTVGKWRSGKTLVPAGVWQELAGLIEGRLAVLPGLLAAVTEAAEESG